MYSILPTIKVYDNRTGDYMIINASDFDPAKHKEWTDGQKAETVEAETVETHVSEPTDDELRDAIEALTGKKPHHRVGRAKLIDMLKEAQDNA